MTLIDSHAHLGDPAYDDDRDEVLRRAAAAGVGTVVVIGNDPESSRRAVDVVRAGGPVALAATAGIAPHHVSEVDAAGIDAVEGLVEAPGVIAVGEIGLDYHYDMPREAQRRLFARQIDWAVQRDLPIVVHSREAEDDVLALIRRHATGPRPLRGVIHCFTESPAMAAAAVELGFWISFAGILTFKNADELRRTAAGVPLERCLIETDSPFLAPTPHRGKRNEPAWVVEVARTLAEVHGVDLDRVAAATTEGARELFGLR